jgi:hypothetical protein
MHVIEVATGNKHDVIIETLHDKDYKLLTKKKYFFNWKTEQQFDVYKLRIVDGDEILGVMSLLYNNDEKWVKINLISTSIENRGRNKKYERIIGNLLAYACTISVGYYGDDACVTLDPKTRIKQHYINKYGMFEVAYKIFLQDLSLTTLVNKYYYEIE